MRGIVQRESGRSISIERVRMTRKGKREKGDKKREKKINVVELKVILFGTRLQTWVSG